MYLAVVGEHKIPANGSDLFDLADSMESESSVLASFPCNELVQANREILRQQRRIEAMSQSILRLEHEKQVYGPFKQEISRLKSECNRIRSQNDSIKSKFKRLQGQKRSLNTNLSLLKVSMSSTSVNLLRKILVVDKSRRDLARQLGNQKCCLLEKPDPAETISDLEDQIHLLRSRVCGTRRLSGLVADSSKNTFTGPSPGKRNWG